MAVIPEGWGEREPRPRSSRWPKKLMERVERISRETHHDLTDTLFHLVRWACDEYDEQKRKEKAENK